MNGGLILPAGATAPTLGEHVDIIVGARTDPDPLVREGAREAWKVLGSVIGLNDGQLFQELVDGIDQDNVDDVYFAGYLCAPDKDLMAAVHRFIVRGVDTKAGMEALAHLVRRGFVEVLQAPRVAPPSPFGNFK